MRKLFTALVLAAALVVAMPASVHAAPTPGEFLAMYWSIDLEDILRVWTKGGDANGEATEEEVPIPPETTEAGGGSDPNGAP